MNLKTRVLSRLPFVRGIVKPSSVEFPALWVTPSGLLEFHPQMGLEQKISKIMREQGSDKSTDHDYHKPYSWLLSNLPRTPGPILEIGLGTNNIDVVSHMGINGVPGASLRGWRELALFTEVWGADVDKRVLFTEQGIETRFVDQLDESSIAALASEVATQYRAFGGFALVIDDGLHKAEANINVIRGLWQSVMIGGYLCVEDLHPGDLHAVMSYVITSLPDADWALWSNNYKRADNQMLILKRRAGGFSHDVTLE